MSQRIVLITGGSEGMGLATAVRFAEAGDQVIVSGRSHAKLNKVKKHHPNIYTISSDISISEDRKSLISEVKDRFGKIDVLFSNVGVGLFKPLEEITEEEFDNLSNVNYKGTFFILQESLRVMSEGGRIIVNASWTHIRGMKNCSLYGSTKAALSYMVKSLAFELADRGINVNAVSPGYINTAQFNEDLIGEETAQKSKRHVPMQRFGKPEEIANTVYFLASEQASYINGQDLVIDGGLTAVHSH